MTRFINPAAHRSPTYADVFTADITTRAEIDAHEERIYQTDYTLKAIREIILRLLTTTAKTALMVNFQVKDIPPKRYDAITHASPLQILAETRKHFDPSDQRHNSINREMYRVYAPSAYIVHDNNFLSYCKPALRNLPVNTAIKLTTLRAKTLADAVEQPPYTHVHHPSTVQTKTVLPTSRSTYADVIREARGTRTQSRLDEGSTSVHVR
jgi:hypothetical protein